MRIVTGSEMKRIDAWAIEEKGLPALLLMENAGRAVAKSAQEILGSPQGSRVVVVAGKGNNGGDALVAARHLHQQGAEVRLFLLFSPDSFQEATLENWRLVENLALTWYLLEDENSFSLLKMCLTNCDLVIDGIFGTGFKGNPRGATARAICIINESKVPVLAIDIPSGLDADTGRVGVPCINAYQTVTMAWAKRGLVVYPGKKQVGKLEVADISLPREGLNLLAREEHYVDQALARPLLPARDWEGHKNTFGHLLVIAGSPGMTGAAYLASKAGLRAGAGMVTACLPLSLALVFDASLPEVITKGVAETGEGTIAGTAWPEISSLLERKKAVVFGPGLSTQPGVEVILERLLRELAVPLVLDADALNVLSAKVELLQVARAPVILTPHPGEMARLLKVTTAQVQENRVKMAQEAAEWWEAIVVLKGAATVTAVPGGKTYINSTGNPALATAGTGDVLAGTIGGLLAQGMNPEDAAVLGVFLHGLSGDLLAEEKGLRGVLASDVLEFLPKAIRVLELGGEKN